MKRELFINSCFWKGPLALCEAISFLDEYEFLEFLFIANKHHLRKLHYTIFKNHSYAYNFSCRKFTLFWHWSPDYYLFYLKHFCTNGPDISVVFLFASFHFELTEAFAVFHKLMVLGCYTDWKTLVILSRNE